MPSKYFITYNQKEQAERMAAKWQARSEAFWSGNKDGWGYQTAGYCKTADEAEQAEQQAGRIYTAINKLEIGCGTWDDVKIIREAVAERDELDAGVAIQKAIH